MIADAEEKGLITPGKVKDYWSLRVEISQNVNHSEDSLSYFFRVF